MSIFSWLKRRKKWINKTEQITTMENLLKCDGRRFRAKIDGTPCEGKIRVEDAHVLLCQDKKNGAFCKDKLGYKYAWCIAYGSEEDITSHSVTDFQLLGMTAAEIEAYKDWQVGDKVSNGKFTIEVIFRSGELVVCKNEEGSAMSNLTCDELYLCGYRLVADPEPEDETVELTMDEIAEKVGIPVEKLRIKKDK